MEQATLEQTREAMDRATECEVKPVIIVVVRGGVVQEIRCNQDLSLSTCIVDYDDIFDEVTNNGEEIDPESDLARLVTDGTLVQEKADDPFSAKLSDQKYPFWLY